MAYVILNDSFYEKNPPAGLIALKYDSNNKSLTIIDGNNKQVIDNITNEPVNIPTKLSELTNDVGFLTNANINQQDLQMGHRLPLSQGHFNNPHLQYSTCCLHRDNFGTQKPTRTTWGQEPWRGRDPGATHLHNSPFVANESVWSLFMLEDGGRAAHFLQSTSTSMS